jgi:hypothetical protein
MSTETAANVVAAGASGLLIASLGVEPQAIVWALVGSILGLTLAKPASRAYAVALFVASTLACALFATWISDNYFAGSAGARNVCAVVLAASFHPLFEAFISAIPGLVAAFAKRARAALLGSPKP